MIGEENNNFINVIEFIIRWKKPLIIVSLCAAILSAILFSPPFTYPKYEASVIFYPSNSVSVSKALVSEHNLPNSDFLAVGETQQGEQLLQILKSDVIASKVNARYKLMEHYRIKPDSRHARTKFQKRFWSNVKPELTEYMSISVSVLDEDPELAASIANYIVAIMDTVRNQIVKDRAIEGLAIVEKDYIEKKEQIQNIVDSLAAIANKGIYDNEKQSDALTTGYANALIKGNNAAIKEINEKMQLLAKYGSAQQKLQTELKYETEQMVILRSKYRQAKIDVESFIPYKFIIENAYKPEIKAYPKRLIIVLISFFFAFFSCCVFCIFWETYNKSKTLRTK